MLVWNSSAAGYLRAGAVDEMGGPKAAGRAFCLSSLNVECAARRNVSRLLLWENTC